MLGLHVIHIEVAPETSRPLVGSTIPIRSDPHVLTVLDISGSGDSPASPANMGSTWYLAMYSTTGTVYSTVHCPAWKCTCKIQPCTCSMYRTAVNILLHSRAVYLLSSNYSSTCSVYLITAQYSSVPDYCTVQQCT